MLVMGAKLIMSAPAALPEDDLVALAPAVAADPAPHLSEPQAVAELVQATPAPAPTRVVSSDTQFERVLRPLLLEAKRHRKANAAEDPAYWSRLDPKLNATRLNFLLFGYGETHEPPLTERAFIASLTIFPHDYATRQIDLVSLTHDIRAPEAERYLHDQGQGLVGPIKIDRAFGIGGFDLMRRTVEDATGLVIDYQLAFRESAIQGATDNVFGGLDVDVPLGFHVNGFYLDGVQYPGGVFQKGLPRLNGIR